MVFHIQASNPGSLTAMAVALIHARWQSSLAAALADWQLQFA
jgi:hypothetical protein